MELLREMSFLYASIRGVNPEISGPKNKISIGELKPKRLK
jgi:hypothetical protein